jgi:hypothetical protein
MDQKPTSSSSSLANDVLHSDPNHSKLSQEEIAKAIAHHNKNHPSSKVQASAPSGGGSGKSQSGNKKK